MKYKKVLVTGSSGFIGSHVADTLEELGFSVVLFDVVPSRYKSKTQEEFLGDILTPGDIEKAIEMYKNSNADLVVSVVKNKVHPIHMGTLGQDGNFSEVSSRLANLPTGNRQQHKPHYIMNGCVYLFGWDYFKRESGIFPRNGRTVAFEMPELNSIEIDEMNELDLARYFVDQGKIDFNEIIGKGN